MSILTRKPAAIKDKRIVRKRVASLKPSPENQQLYRAVVEDPDIKSLAESIRKNGLHERLTITQDNYILSGHRRLQALNLIGQQWVECMQIGKRRDSFTTDEYVALLRDHNRQRNKTVAEQIREELVDVDPQDAHARLLEHRAKLAYGYDDGELDLLRVEGKKRRPAISPAKADHVKYIKQVVFDDRRDYWPLSVRGIHYALLNYEFCRNIGLRIKYVNDDDSYSKTSDLLTRLRLDGTIPWSSIDDGTRPLKVFNAFNDVRHFIRHESKNFCRGYWRKLQQSQVNHIEVLCEKNTVYSMVLRVTNKYQIPTSSGRGFNSIDPWYDLYQRFLASKKRRLILIVVSDFDPEGEIIPHVAGRTLRDDFGLRNFDIVKAGVTREQITKYDLPSQNFAKESSSNHEWFVERNDGDDSVYELEALDPADLLSELENVVLNTIDVEAFNAEIDREKEEASTLAKYNKAAMKLMEELEI